MKFDKNRIITDETGYNYVRVTPEEILNWGGYCICNSCGQQFLDKDQNLFFAGADVYCDDCFEKMKQRWKTYSKEDLEYDLKLQEAEALNWYKYHLDSDYRHQVNKQYEKDIKVNIDDTFKEFENFFEGDENDN